MSLQVKTTDTAELAGRLSFTQEAHEAAQKSAFADYRSRRAKNTLRRQDVELANFGEYIGVNDLAVNPHFWKGISWGIVEGFIKRMLIRSYTVELQNGKLKAIRDYADEVKPQDQLLKGSRKGGELMGRMRSRAIWYSVMKMGESIGLDNLSPHDVRHTRATRLAGIKNVRELMDWFG